MISEEQILGARILIVDDQPVNILLLSRMLTAAGFTAISSTTDPRETCALYEQLRPSLVVLDLRMPHSDGFEVLKRLREIFHDPVPSVLVATAYSDQPSRLRAFELGARDFLAKPLDRLETLARVRNLVEMRLMYDQMQEQGRQALVAAHQLLGRRNRELAESEDRFRGIFETIQDVFFRVDLQGVFQIVSPSILRYGYQMALPSSQALGSFFSDEQVWDQLKARVLAEHLVEDLEVGILREDGNEAVVSLSVRLLTDAEEQPIGMEGIFRDISEWKQAEARLQHSASHDLLTGLPNRTRFMDRLKFAMLTCPCRAQSMLAVLLLNLDRLKLVNDALGFSAGDQVVLEASRRIESALRTGDTVARIGGDEFAILLPSITHQSTVIRICERILAALYRPLTLGDTEVFLTASIGIALCTSTDSSAEDLLRHADIAMYRAKWRGRACYEFFDAKQHKSPDATLRLESDLRRAIENDQLRVFYQPLLALPEQRIQGAEALVRWFHPQLGSISPVDFIPLAEEAGIVNVIGEWVLRTACSACRSWHAAGHTNLSIAVNCSTLQLYQPGFVDKVAQILNETGLPPSSLELEITEGTAMRDVEFSREVFGLLKRMGVKISIDDFGTGYSSLSYLQRFPIDVLKVDRSFVKDLPEDQEAAAIASVIVSLGHALGLEVLAEGIETSDQLAVLTALGCDRGQGFLFSRPVPEEDLLTLVRRGIIVSADF